jgi:hypothetical protein
VFDRGRGALSIPWIDEDAIEESAVTDDLEPYLKSLTARLETINLTQLSERIARLYVFVLTAKGENANGQVARGKFVIIR